ncbi:MAG: TolC family protein [Gemmataceae bacterium]
MRTMLMAAVLAILVPTWAGAEAESQSLSYEELAREALSKGPEAAKIGATLADRAAEAFSTKVKENPVLDLKAEFPLNPPSVGREDTGVGVTLSQAIRPSDFGQRTELAKLIQETADSEQVLALNELLANLSVLYARAWQFQETEKLLKDARGGVTRILNRVTGPQASGAFGEGDVQLLRSELEQFEADGIAARGDAARALAELTRSSGVALSGRMLKKPANNLSVSREDLDRLVRESKLPIQRRFALLKEVSRKRLEVARADAFPPVSPQIGFSHHDDGTDQIVAGISIPLSIFNRNQAEQMRAQGELSVAEQGERYATSDAIVAEALQLYDAAIDTGRQLAMYETKVLPAKARAVEAYYRQFEGGGASAFQLWQAQRELNDSRRRSLELISALADVRAKLVTLVGQPQF